MPERGARKRDILLCDLDAFFAAVEQRDHPEYRGKPVIVGGSHAARGVVSTCSYEARRFGVHSAMPMRKALQLCPGAVVLTGDMARYRAASEQVLAVFDRITPDIEPVSIDEAYLAVPRGEGTAAAGRIRAAVRGELGLPISVGVSANKLLAKIACGLAKPDGLKALWPEDVPELLWPLPVKVLPGLGPVSAQKLNSVGIKTVGQLAAAPAALLRRLLGNTAALLQQHARGIDDRGLEQCREAKSISEERTFPADVTDRETVLAVLIEQAEGLGYRLRSARLLARTIGIKLRFADFTTITRDQTLPAPTDLDAVIYGTARGLFLRCGGRLAWRLVGIRVSGLESSRQLSLFDPPPGEFKEQNLDLVLLSDPEHKLLEVYGAWTLKKNYGKEYMGVQRSTYLIDPQGKIAHAWPNVKAEGHAANVKEKLAELKG